MNGGERGIRTPGTRWGTAVFKTAAFDRSAISPVRFQDSEIGVWAQRPGRPRRGWGRRKQFPESEQHLWLEPAEIREENVRRVRG